MQRAEIHRPFFRAKPLLDSVSGKKVELFPSQLSADGNEESKDPSTSNIHRTHRKLPIPMPKRIAIIISGDVSSGNFEVALELS